MGVKGLWKALKHTTVALEDLRGKKVAVDTSIWMHHVQEHNVVSVFMKRIVKLTFFGIKPVFVFDGGAPPLKKKTLLRRRTASLKAESYSNKVMKRVLSAIGRDTERKNVKKQAANELESPCLDEKNVQALSSSCETSTDSDSNSTVDINSPEFETLPDSKKQLTLLKYRTRFYEFFDQTICSSNTHQEFMKKQLAHIAKRNKVTKSLNELNKQQVIASNERRFELKKLDAGYGFVPVSDEEFIEVPLYTESAKTDVPLIKEGIQLPAKTKRAIKHHEDSTKQCAAPSSAAQKTTADEGKNKTEPRDVSRLPTENAQQKEQNIIEGFAQRVSTGSILSTELQELFFSFGIPYVIAPMEAEAQCAYMQSTGLVDAVVSDDCDTLLFGASIVYRNMFRKEKPILMYTIDTIGYQRTELVNMALLLGCDYTDGVKGVGTTRARELVRMFGVEKGISFRQFILTRPKDYLPDDIDFSDYDSVREAFLSPVVAKTKLEWKEPELERMVVYLTKRRGMKTQEAYSFLRTLKFVNWRSSGSK